MPSLPVVGSESHTGDEGRMQFDWHYFLAALGLAFVLEGVAYFLGANQMHAMLKLLAQRPAAELRLLGGVAIIAGLLLVWLARL